MKILFIDDDMSSLTLLKMAFKQSIYECEYISNPEDVKTLDLNSYDLIVTDYLMPLMNGFEVIEYCKNINKNLQFILLTAISELETIRESFKLNIIAYVLKPLNRYLELDNAIQKAKINLDNRKLEKSISNKLNRAKYE